MKTYAEWAPKVRQSRDALRFLRTLEVPIYAEDGETVVDWGYLVANLGCVEWWTMVASVHLGGGLRVLEPVMYQDQWARIETLDGR